MSTFQSSKLSDWHHNRRTPDQHSCYHSPFTCPAAHLFTCPAAHLLPSAGRPHHAAVVEVSANDECYKTRIHCRFSASVGLVRICIALVSILVQLQVTAERICTRPTLGILSHLLLHKEGEGAVCRRCE